MNTSALSLCEREILWNHCTVGAVWSRCSF
uniref:Uncharacterized protein n=1 Tax=Anguilla anguilla TaxID=7936 RepID=A0A0E9QHG0_ANGAN